MVGASLRQSWRGSKRSCRRCPPDSATPAPVATIPAENLDLRDAMDALALLEGRIGELRALLAAAEPIDDDASRDGVIRLGAHVKIRHADGEEASYMLVSPAEADPRRGRISEESPIGRALVGRKKNEEVTAETPSGPERLVVLDVI